MLNFPALLAAGLNQPIQPVNQNRDPLATLIYTSGTSGKPKGVWAIIAQNLQPRLPEEAGKAGKAGENKGSTTATAEIDLENKVVQDLFRQELNREVQNRPGYRADDRIGPYKLIQRTVFDGKWDVDPNAEDPASRCHGTLSRYH